MKVETPFYQRAALRFECTACGACCTAGDGFYVYVTNGEIDKISNFLGISSSWCKRRYLQKVPDEGWVVGVNEDETCIFLSEDRRCTIYVARPEQCSTYPFWPEIVLHKRDWLNESKRCEGIGRGKIVSKKVIMARLKQQAQGES